MEYTKVYFHPPVGPVMTPKRHSIATDLFCPTHAYLLQKAALHVMHVWATRRSWECGDEAALTSSHVHLCGWLRTLPTDCSTVGLPHTYAEVGKLFCWLAEKLTISLPSNRFPPHQYGTTNFTSGLSLRWMTPNQSVSLHNNSLHNIVSLSTNLRVHIHNSLIPLDCRIKVKSAYVNFMCFMRATCPVHPIILDLPTLIQFCYE